LTNLANLFAALLITSIVLTTGLTQYNVGQIARAADNEASVSFV